jgi:hypothetical protein
MMTGGIPIIGPALELTEAELNLIRSVIRLCPQYRWMRVFGDLREPHPPIGRVRLAWRLRRLPRDDRRQAREWLAEHMPSRGQRLRRRMRRRLGAELYALAVAVEGSRLGHGAGAGSNQRSLSL